MSLKSKFHVFQNKEEDFLLNTFLIIMILFDSNSSKKIISNISRKQMEKYHLT